MSTQEHCGVVMQHANDGHVTQSLHCIEKQALYEEIMRTSKEKKERSASFGGGMTRPPLDAQNSVSRDGLQSQP